MNATLILRTLALILAIQAGLSSRAQGLEEHIHRLHVEGITSTLLEKQCQEALLGFDPEMVVSIDVPAQTVKFKTMHDLPLQDVVNSLNQLGLQARLDVRKEEEHPTVPTH
ncbi:MAG: hypothetical protein JNL05_13475 [Flavobacteriales bacterium]|nr:hypothetical protein [Flavobacteriales bacterium]